MPKARSTLASLASLSLGLAACAKLVGITDTTVSDAGSSDAGLDAIGGSGGRRTPAPERDFPSAASARVGSGGGGGGGSARSAGGSGGSGGAPLALDAGVAADAGEPACSNEATRCGVSGRERCLAGVWQASACPVNQPSCEGDGQCVVRGPALISVGNFFVDATEVTVGQYQQFLAAKAGDTSGQSAVCSWNQSYYEGPMVMKPSAYPMTSVDWCDAAAYCAWAGKHLCGRVGGGPIARADIFTANLSQWFVSCGGGGNHPNNAPLCNSSQGFSDIAPVATFPGCEGYYPGLFDMEGNVREWIDACEGSAGASDVCYVMGGSTLDQRSYCDEVGEDAEDPWLRSSTTGYDGFRCCAG